MNAIPATSPSPLPFPKERAANLPVLDSLRLARTSTETALQRAGVAAQWTPLQAEAVFSQIGHAQVALDQGREGIKALGGNLMLGGATVRNAGHGAVELAKARDLFRMRDVPETRVTTALTEARIRIGAAIADGEARLRRTDVRPSRETNSGIVGDGIGDPDNSSDGGSDTNWDPITGLPPRSWYGPDGEIEYPYDYDHGDGFEGGYSPAFDG